MFNVSYTIGEDFFKINGLPSNESGYISITVLDGFFAIEKPLCYHDGKTSEHKFQFKRFPSNSEVDGIYGNILIEWISNHRPNCIESTTQTILLDDVVGFYAIPQHIVLYGQGTSQDITFYNNNNEIADISNITIDPLDKNLWSYYQINNKLTISAQTNNEFTNYITFRDKSSGLDCYVIIENLIGRHTEDNRNYIEISPKFVQYKKITTIDKDGNDTTHYVDDRGQIYDDGFEIEFSYNGMLSGMPISDVSWSASQGTITDDGKINVTSLSSTTTTYVTVKANTNLSDIAIIQRVEENITYDKFGLLKIESCDEAIVGQNGKLITPHQDLNGITEYNFKFAEKTIYDVLEDLETEEIIDAIVTNTNEFIAPSVTIEVNKTNDWFIASYDSNKISITQSNNLLNIELIDYSQLSTPSIIVLSDENGNTITINFTVSENVAKLLIKEFGFLYERNNLRDNAILDFDTQKYYDGDVVLTPYSDSVGEFVKKVNANDDKSTSLSIKKKHDDEININDNDYDAWFFEIKSALYNKGLEWSITETDVFLPIIHERREYKYVPNPNDPDGPWIPWYEDFYTYFDFDSDIDQNRTTWKVVLVNHEDFSSENNLDFTARHKISAYTHTHNDGVWQPDGLNPGESRDIIFLWPKRKDVDLNKQRKQNYQITLFNNALNKPITLSIQNWGVEKQPKTEYEMNIDSSFTPISSDTITHIIAYEISEKELDAFDLIITPNKYISGMNNISETLPLPITDDDNITISISSNNSNYSLIQNENSYSYDLIAVSNAPINEAITIEFTITMYQNGETQQPPMKDGSWNPITVKLTIKPTPPKQWITYILNADNITTDKNYLPLGLSYDMEEQDMNLWHIQRNYDTDKTTYQTVNGFEDSFNFYMVSVYDGQTVSCEVSKETDGSGAWVNNISCQNTAYTYSISNIPLKLWKEAIVVIDNMNHNIVSFIDNNGICRYKFDGVLGEIDDYNELSFKINEENVYKVRYNGNGEPQLIWFNKENDTFIEKKSYQIDLTDPRPLVGNVVEFSVSQYDGTIDEDREEGNTATPSDSQEQSRELELIFTPILLYSQGEEIDVTKDKIKQNLKFGIKQTTIRGIWSLADNGVDLVIHKPDQISYDNFIQISDVTYTPSLFIPIYEPLNTFGNTTLNQTYHYSLCEQIKTNFLQLDGMNGNDVSIPWHYLNNRPYVIEYTWDANYLEELSTTTEVDDIKLYDYEFYNEEDDSTIILTPYIWKESIIEPKLTPKVQVRSQIFDFYSKEVFNSTRKLPHLNCFTRQWLPYLFGFWDKESLDNKTFTVADNKSWESNSLDELSLVSGETVYLYVIANKVTLTEQSCDELVRQNTMPSFEVKLINELQIINLTLSNNLILEKLDETANVNFKHDDNIFITYKAHKIKLTVKPNSISMNQTALIRIRLDDYIEDTDKNNLEFKFHI